jgi:site-specific DNA recombinase
VADMKNAIIYTRVSTDEQADKGFSLPYQKEVLDRFCNVKNINIIKHYQDDYSAKTFNRPEWTKLMAFCKANRKEVDQILFTKWDRFSRNAGEAYQVIDSLRKLGIKINSIEQPLDFEQPDNKIMLAIYLAVPEVENDKISIRVTEGSRRANKEGCWTSTAPIGYKNQRTLDGKASLISTDKAELIKETFEILARTKKPVDEVRRIMQRKGLRVSKSRFHLLVKNPVYVGKVKVPAYKNEDEFTVEGLHQGIVSERLFNEVQDVLTGRKRTTKIRTTKDESLPLRGHLICPRCGRNLTGSASKGRHGGRFYYYHCRSGCKERVKASEVHEIFDHLISIMTIDQGVADLYVDIMKEQYGDDKASRTRKINKIESQINTLKETIERAEDNLFEGKIDAATFEKGKERYSQKIRDFRFELEELKNTGANFMTNIKKCVSIIQNLKTHYESGSWNTKQMILGSIFPNKMVFENKECRTPQLNTTVSHIYQVTRNLLDKKKGQVLNNLNLSCRVNSEGLEPPTSWAVTRCTIHYATSPIYSLKTLVRYQT